MPTDGRRRVAVIAVHGVADQRPQQTVGAIVDLLANLQTSDGPAYGRFSEEKLDIPVRRVEVPNPEHAQELFYDRAPRLRERCDLTIPIGAGEPTRDMDAGLEFMSTLLSQYVVSGPEETYETTVMRATRTASGNTAPIDVDVYEMYWADLSRLASSAFRIFADAYQLLFHVATLGLHVVTAAQAEEREIGGPWKGWAWAQRYASDCLAVYIVLLNVILVALGLVLVPQMLPDQFVAPAALVVAALAVGSVIGYRCFRAGVGTFTLWTAPLVIFCAGGGGALAMHAAYGTRLPPHARELLMTESLGIVAILVGILVVLYDIQRPRVKPAGAVMGIVFGGVLLGTIWGSSGDMVTAVFRDVEVVYLALALAWTAFIVLSWVAFELGRRVKSYARGTPSADRVSRVAWTARLTLAVPAALFLISTLVLWGGLLAASRSLLHARCFTPVFLTWLVPGRRDLWVDEFVGALITNGGTIGFSALFAAASLSAVMSAYSLAPIVVTEVFPYKSIVPGARTGIWLDHAYAMLRLAGRVLIVGLLALLPLGAMLFVLIQPAVWKWVTGHFHLSDESLYPFTEWLYGVNLLILIRAAALLVPAAAGLLAFGGRLKSLALGFRNILDVALDVDNYLRARPATATPRARIAARFASLLRYVYAQPYDAFVIVAHSQGTVITADLLRFITAAGLERSDDGLARRCGRPIRFFTMGSPLRQLYGLRFPHLYAWARHELREKWTDPATPIDQAAVPDPKQLDVKVWVNAYRSGDYVGRYLWRPEESPFLYATVDGPIKQPWLIQDYRKVVASSTAAPVTRREFCIGAGAHTHYWDRTAPQIAVQLDELIAETPRD